MLEKVIERNVQALASISKKPDLFEQKIVYSAETRKFYLIESTTFNLGRGESGYKVFIFDQASNQLAAIDGVQIFGSRLIVNDKYAITIKDWSTSPIIKVKQ